MKMKNRVLAVLALALLMINMAPVMRAEAASVIAPWAGGENYTISNEYSYYLYYVYEDDSEVMYVLFFANSPITVQTKTDVRYVNFESDGCCYIYRDYKATHFTDADGFFEYKSGVSAVSFGGKAWKNVYSNHDILEIGTSDIMFYANPLTSEPVYFSDAPYLKDVVFSNVNNFLIDGNTDFTQSFFRYTFELGNAEAECVSRKTQISGYVYLPSKDFINNAKDYYLGGRNTLDEYYSIYSCEYYPTWLVSLDLGDGSTFKKWYFTTEFDCTDSAVLRLSHQDIYELVEQYNGIDLREYYGISDIAYIDHVLKGYMWIHRMDGIVYTTYSDAVNYGNLTSFICSTNLKDVVVSTGSSNPLLYGPSVDFAGPMLPDSDVHQSIEQAYKDALEEAKKVQEENLKLDADSEDVFNLFSSLSNGLATMSGSVRSIAVAVGNVFAFFPVEITSVLYAGLIAMVVIAVYKALRG